MTAEYDRAYTSGIKIARTLYDPSWANPAWPTVANDWTSAKQLALYSWIAAMQTRDIKVALNTGWSFPGALVQPFDDTSSVVAPTPTQENNWAAWISESLNQMINVRGYTNVMGLVLFTEPPFSLDVIPVGYTAIEYYVHLAEVLDAKIIADDAGRTPIRPGVSLIGPNEQSFTTDSWIEQLRVIWGTGGPIDIYSSHSYCQTPTFAPLGLAAANCPAYSVLRDMFENWVGDSAPKPFLVDEGNTVVGGNFDSTGYRATADAGWQFCKWLVAHMAAGAVTSMFWTLDDVIEWPAPAGSTTQAFGIASDISVDATVKPSWYAVSLLANLTGGGGVTEVFESVGDTSTLYGVAAHIPFGQRHTVNPNGEWSFVLINEGPAIPNAGYLTTSIGGRTLYRYVYSGEMPPTAAANPAYLIPWDRQFTNVTTLLPNDIIPGRSVVIYSTINLQAPTAVNLALSAAAYADSTGIGAASRVNDGNFTNVQGAVNGWRKADNASHYVELSWASAQTIGRLELAFVATTAGVVYATYTDTSTPAPCADYGVQYWNGSSFVAFSTPVAVTANASPNRSHSFTPVSTTKIRMTVTSVAATGQVNQIGVFAS